MHWNFSTVEILWTLTFAAVLVLLVVLLGRDRIRRFPWFTASILLAGLRMLASRMLFGKMSPLASSETFLTLADITALVSLGVVVELARRIFTKTSRTAWAVGSAILLAGSITVLVLWGPWPAWKTLTAGSTLAHLRLMQLLAQRVDLLSGLLVIELAIVLIFVGRRLQAGWRSHAQQIVFGLATASAAQMVVRIVLQRLASAGPPQSQAEYLRLTGIQERLINGNSIVYIGVLVWWIICLWIDEPGSKRADANAPAAELHQAGE